MANTSEQNIESAVLVPAGQAIITGVLGGVASWYISAFSNWGDPWEAVGLAASVATLGSWLAFRSSWARRSDVAAGVLEPIPQAARVYQAETVTHRLAITWDGGRAGSWVELAGVDWIKFVTWSVAISRGVSMGENYWIGSHGDFSKGEYHRMLAKLQERGLIRRKGKHHAQGYELSGQGRAVTAELARRYGAPSPAEGDSWENE